MVGSEDIAANDTASNDNGIDLTTIKGADDNVIQPFQLDISNLRGRSVRMGSELDNILGPHNYPPVVASLVAETVTLALLLCSMLKYEGIFTLQTKGDGPVTMLAADVTSDGVVRGCATYDKAKLEIMEQRLSKLKLLKNDTGSYVEYLGKGYIAFTVDQGQHMERYQGIVELKGTTLAGCVQHYFDQSEQIKTDIVMAAEESKEHGWRSGGVMIQRMPEEDKGIAKFDEEDWNRAHALLRSTKREEMLDPELHSHRLLHRLFHEEGVRVFTPQPVKKGCRCSRERVETILTQLPEEDREHLVVDGKIVMHCDFCASEYVFTLDDVPV